MAENLLVAALKKHRYHGQKGATDRQLRPASAVLGTVTGSRLTTPQGLQTLLRNHGVPPVDAIRPLAVGDRQLSVVVEVFAKAADLLLAYGCGGHGRLTGFVAYNNISFWLRCLDSKDSGWVQPAAQRSGYTICMEDRGFGDLLAFEERELCLCWHSDSRSTFWSKVVATGITIACTEV